MGRAAKAKAKDLLIRQAAIEAPCVVSTEFLKKPPAWMDLKTQIYLWGTSGLFPEVKDAEDGEGGAAASSSSSSDSTEYTSIVISSLPWIKITKAVAGDRHLLLLDHLGGLYAMGMGESGQLGLGEGVHFTREPQRVTAQPAPCTSPFNGSNGAFKVKAMACGSAHSLAVTDEGAVYSWGDNAACGGARILCSHWPTKVSLKNPDVNGPEEFVVDVAAHHSHSIAATRTLRIYAWGFSFFCRYLLRPTLIHQLEDTKPMADCPLEIKQISLGRQFAIILNNRGVAFVWGDGTYGELARTSPASLALSRAELPERLPMTDAVGASLPPFCQVAAGSRYGFLLAEDGRLWSFGENLCGQCGVPLFHSRVTVPRAVKAAVGDIRCSVMAVAAGSRHAGCITKANQLMMWGHSSNHKLIFTASSAMLMERRYGAVPGQMGVATRSGLRECCPKPRMIFSLLHLRVTQLALGAEITVVVTGDGQDVSGVPSFVQQSSIGDPEVKEHEDPSPLAPASDDGDKAEDVEEEEEEEAEVEVEMTE